MAESGVVSNAGSSVWVEVFYVWRHVCDTEGHPAAGAKVDEVFQKQHQAFDSSQEIVPNLSIISPIIGGCAAGAFFKRFGFASSACCILSYIYCYRFRF